MRTGERDRPHPRRVPLRSLPPQRPPAAVVGSYAARPRTHGGSRSAGEGAEARLPSAAAEPGLGHSLSKGISQRSLATRIAGDALFAAYPVHLLLMPLSKTAWLRALDGNKKQNKTKQQTNNPPHLPTHPPKLKILSHENIDGWWLEVK